MVRRHCWEALRDLPVAFAVDADRCASDLGSSLAREPENVEPEGIEPSCVPFRRRCYGTSIPERPHLAWSDLGQLANVRGLLSPRPQTARVVRADRVCEVIGLLTEPAEEGSDPPTEAAHQLRVSRDLGIFRSSSPGSVLPGGQFKLLFVGVAAKVWPTLWSAAARHSDEVVDALEWTIRSSSDLCLVPTQA